jgi:type II secretory pathway component PulJ
MKQRQSGFTLVELMLYMLFCSVLLIGFSKQFKLLLNHYVAGKNEVKQFQDSQNILAVMERDIRNTGLKVYMSSGAKITPNYFVSDTLFIHKTGNPYDTLVLFKAILNSNGALSGNDTVSYFVDAGKNLVRKYSTSQIDSIAGNVYALQFVYGTSVDNTSISIPMTTANFTVVNSSGTAPTISGTANLCISFGSTAGVGSVKYSTAIAVSGNYRYSVKMLLTPNKDPSKFLDSMAITFRNGTTVIGRETFLPRLDTIRISVPVSTTVASSTISFDYNSKAAGSVTLKYLAVTCVDNGVYQWCNVPSTKKNIRAIRVHVLTRMTGDVMSASSMLTIADASITKSAGRYTWRLYDEVIEMPNNGGAVFNNALTSGTNLVDLKIRPMLLSIQY